MGSPLLLPFVISMLLGLTLFVGCGGPRYEYADVQGQVTIDGEPVPKGYVTFSPAGDGPVTGGPINNGSYRVEKVPIGAHTVTFTAQAAETQTIRDVANDAIREVPIDILPPQYRSGIDASVIKDQVALDFPLRSSGPP